MATYTIGAAGPPTYDYANLTAFLSDFNAPPFGGGTLIGAVVAEIYGTVVDSSPVSILPALAVTSLTFRPAAGQENNGVVGAGARCEQTGAGNDITLNRMGLSVLSEIVFEDLEFRGKTSGGPSVFRCGTSDGPLIIRRCIFINRNTTAPGFGDTLEFQFAGPDPAISELSVINNMVFNPSGCLSSNGILLFETGGALGTETWNIDNNTCYGFTQTGLFTDNSFGSGATLNVRNNISVGSGIIDYSGGGVTVFSDNLSSDASGTAGLTSKPAVDQFKDATQTIAAVDMRLKAGADAIAAGSNLGNTDEVNLDIASFNRFPFPTWDVGANEFAVGGALFQFDQLTGGMPDLRGGMV